MADHDYQEDLFGEGAYGKKVARPRILNRYYKQRVLPQLRLPVEYTVIAAIGVLVLVVIAYAVGVERGKSIAAVKMPDMPVEELISAGEELEISSGPEDVEAGLDLELEQEGAPGSLEESGAPEEAAGEQAGSGVISVYVIQLASFKNESSAVREVKKLAKSGFDAGVARKGEWYQVFAQGYDTIDEATRAKRDLRETYVDCYIRRVK